MSAALDNSFQETFRMLEETSIVGILRNFLLISHEMPDQQD